MNKVFDNHYCNRKKDLEITYPENYNKNYKIFQVVPEDPQYFLNPMWKYSFGVYYPHLIPLDLFENISEISLATPKLRNILNQIDSQMQNTNYNLYFLTNFCTKPFNEYKSILIPKYSDLIKHLKIKPTNVGIGSPDTFLKLNPEESKQNLVEFITDNCFDEISLNLTSKNKVSIDSFQSQKYIGSGILQNSKFPIEPVFIKKIREKKEIINKFEKLLSKNSKEPALQKFLNEHYNFFLGNDYDSIRTEFWIKSEIIRTKHGKRFDLFLRNSISNDYEIFELKRPVRKIVKWKRNEWQFASKVHDAITQAKYYKKHLEKESVKKYCRSIGIEYHQIQIRVIIGRLPQIPQEIWRFLVASEPNCKIITYDEVLEKAKTQLKDFIELLSFTHNL